MKLKEKVALIGVFGLTNAITLGMVVNQHEHIQQEAQKVQSQINSINRNIEHLGKELSELKKQPTCDKPIDDIEENVELKPVEKQPVARTAPQPIQEKEKPKENTSHKEVNVRVSFYTSLAEENGGYAGMNAINGKLKLGSISAPKSVPFGSKISISKMQDYLGITDFTVDDRGGAIYIRDDGTYKLDVYVPKKQGESDNEYFNRVNNMGIVNTKAKIYFK